MRKIKTFRQFEAMDPDAFAKALDQMQPKKMDDYQKPSYSIHQTMSTKKDDGKTFKFGGGDPDKQSDRPYVVKKGDTVFGLAKKLGLTVEDFVSMYMPGEDPSNLRIGQEIYLPGPLVAELEGGYDEYEDSDMDWHSLDRPYVVKQGETIYSIAKKLGLSVDNFMDLYGYGIEDPSKVRVGTEIYLPGHIAAELEH